MIYTNYKTRCQYLIIECVLDPLLIDSLIGQPYWTALLDSLIEQTYYTDLILDSLIGQPYWTDLLDSLIEQPYWTALMYSLIGNSKD